MARHHTDMRRLFLQVFADYAAANRLLDIARLAKELWPAFWPIPEDLHPIAAIAVEHYATENAGTDMA